MSRLRKALFGLLAAQFALADMDDNGGGGGGSNGVGVVTWADQPPNGDSLQLTLTNSSGQPNPIQYNVVPIVDQGLDGSDTLNQTVVIDGILVAVDQSNFQSAMETDAVAYLSCDRPPEGADTYITADVMLNGLIDNSVKAIVLYSQVKNGCVLGNTGSLRYWSILSMIDAGDAQQVLSYLNATATGRMQVSISGNASQPDPGGPFASQGSSSNSAVAMSILYSITGLIALLFLIIIGTGAVRAHRYPERYGPRVAVAGRPRQSRAKGLARAVLDTIPIVKFGNSQRTPKPDPEMELDATTTDGRDAGAGAVAQRVVSSHPTTEDTAAEATPAVAAVEDGDDGSQAGADSQRQNDEENGDDGEEANGSQLGCSICTEDFKVGEDMRVLPCNHQFHPNCIDPWLVNVSGTCPLCRLDLRRQARPLPEGSSVNRSSALPPPLPLESEGSDEAGSSASNRRDTHRLRVLRQASAEEQMAALRAMGRRGEAEADGEERGQRARLTVRLRDRFRIRTRASPGNE